MGVFEDNSAAGKLSLVFSSTGQTLSGESSYSGTTVISQMSSVGLTGNGSILSTSEITLGVNASLEQFGTANSNRISDATRILLQGGTFSADRKLCFRSGRSDRNRGFFEFFRHHSNRPRLGGGKTHDRQSQPGRFRHVNFRGTGTISANVANLPSGILQPYFTSSNEWATRSAEGTISAFSGYAADINSATAGSHVKIVLALELRNWRIRDEANSEFSECVLFGTDFDLGSFRSHTRGRRHSLQWNEQRSAIENGRLRAAGQELVVTNRNDLVVSASVAEGNSAMSLTKSGAGVLTLSGS